MSRPEEALVAATRTAASRAIAGEAVAAAGPMVEHILAIKRLNTVEECQALVDAAKVCRLGQKSLEDQLDTILRPLKEAQKAAKALSDPLTKKLDEAIKHAKRLYEDFDARQKAEEARRVAEQQRLAREAAEREAAAAKELKDAGMQDDVDVAPEASAYQPPPPSQVRGGIGGMHKSSLKRMRVTNLAAAVTHHPELFNIELRQNDSKAALARLRASDPDATLVGIEEYEETSTSLT